MDITKPQRSFDTNFGRFYAHPSQISVSAISRQGLEDPYSRYAPKPSITNIIGVMNEGFLPSFYAKLVATYAVEHVDEIVYQAGKFGENVAIGNLKAVVNRPHPASAIGDEVHTAIDDFAHGELHSSEDFATNTAWQMFRQFRNFATEHNVEITRSEFTVWSYQHGYAGTGDLMFSLNGIKWLVDTKTGTSVWPKVAMQVAALNNADVILDVDGSEHPMTPSDKLGVLHVRPRSCRLYELQNTEEAFQAFLGLKTVFDWKRNDADGTIPQKPSLESKA